MTKTVDVCGCQFGYTFWICKKHRLKNDGLKISEEGRAVIIADVRTFSSPNSKPKLHLILERYGKAYRTWSVLDATRGGMRGATAKHKTLPQARKRLDDLSEEAKKLGWVRIA